MHGAPVTLQVTSPTSRLFSVIVRVVVMRPLISSARTTPLDNRSAAATRLAHVQNLVVRMARSSLNDSEECCGVSVRPPKTASLYTQSPPRAADLFVAQGTPDCRKLTWEAGSVLSAGSRDHVGGNYS